MSICTVVKHIFGVRRRHCDGISVYFGRHCAACLGSQVAVWRMAGRPALSRIDLSHKERKTMKQLVSALALAFVGTTAFAQSVAVSCPATPAALGTAGAGWSIASVGPVTRTSTPAAPPAAGYAPAVPAALLDDPPVPPEPGYAWSAGSWI